MKQVTQLSKKELLGWVLGTLVSIILYAGAYYEKFPISTTEVLGFATGAACVWLTVKQNIWNWPIGIANNVFFIILFWNARLFADMGLQVVYVVLGLWGWYWWLFGGKNKSELKVSRCTKLEWVLILILSIISTYGMTLYLQSINDTAPFLDALTTIMSLAAQYLLTKKYLENWWIWISADVIYIGLYFYKSLYLTGVLYFIFLLMCIVGYRQWKQSFKNSQLPVAQHPGVSISD